MRSGAFHAAHGKPAPVDPLDPERIEHGKYVAAQAIHRIRAFRHAGAAMPAPVVAHEAKVTSKRRDLGIPHVQCGAERIRQHERGRALRAVDFDVDSAAVRVDDGHGTSFGDDPQRPSFIGR